MKIARLRQEEEIKKFMEGVIHFESKNRKIEEHNLAYSNPKKQKRIKKFRN